MAKEKLYYSIREVADMFNINQSNLRFWEKEFKQLKPRRNDKGTRFYTKENIRTVKTIIYLIEEQKLTLEGVRMRLNEKKNEVEKQQEVVERLTKVRAELKAMISSLGKPDGISELDFIDEAEYLAYNPNLTKSVEEEMEPETKPQESVPDKVKNTSESTSGASQLDLFS